MTEQQIIETLATKVMGWTKHEVELDMTDGSKQKFFDSWQLNGQDVAFHWNPLQSIADAYQVIEQMNENGYVVELIHDKAFKVCRVTEEGSVLQDIYRYRIQEAICTAAVNLTLR